MGGGRVVFSRSRVYCVSTGAPASRILTRVKVVREAI